MKLTPSEGGSMLTLSVGDKELGTVHVNAEEAREIQRFLETHNIMLHAGEALFRATYNKTAFNRDLLKNWYTCTAQGETMDKYGYEQQEQPAGQKLASEGAVCPICGKPSPGSPPVCPDHGSLPFEKMDVDEPCEKK
jgi:hypothetical protein